jgi:hypothetical protein
VSTLPSLLKQLALIVPALDVVLVLGLYLYLSEVYAVPMSCFASRSACFCLLLACCMPFTVATNYMKLFHLGDFFLSGDPDGCCGGFPCERWLWL